MQLTNALTLLAASLSFTSASPTAQTTPKEYKLRTRLHDASHNPRFNNLYVQAYHTGAGLNDATLTSSAKDGLNGYLNGTSQQFVLSTNAETTPYAMTLALLTEYTSWQPVQINTGYGPDSSVSQFYINKNGLQQKDEFHGWRVCDWWHNTPQLFWKGPDAGAAKIDSCSDVDLIPIYN